MAREGVLHVEWSGEAMMLDPRRAAIWNKRKTVLIADPHIGKDDTFRRAGIPVPASVAQADFDRLGGLIEDYAAERLVVLGDFLHARPDTQDACIDMLTRWHDRFAALEVLIVRGNHDWHAGPPPASLGLVSVAEDVCDGPFVYRHFPCEPGALPEAGYVLAGHQHPGVTVVLGGGSARRVPCFHATPRQAVLPAFGRFTGTGRIERTADSAVYAVGRDRVIALPPPAMV